MTTTPERRTATLSEQVAEEIRALLGRRRMSQAQLSRAMGQSQMWVSDRLRGIQPIGLDDLQRFARVLNVEAYELLPSREIAAGAAFPRTTQEYSLMAVQLTRGNVGPRDNRPFGGPRIASARTTYVDRPGRRRRGR